MANELGAVDATLTGMCQRGIYDHLAGGIARYSMVERWLAPKQILPTSHPATGMGQHDGTATAYVCIGQTSSLPQSKSDGLQKALNRATGATGPGY
jgi:uncharacterized protein YyaL (SSP411 family)